MYFNDQKYLIARSVMILALLAGMFGITPVGPAHADTILVTNTADSGAGSLRQAILDAASGDTITFDPSLAGQTIVLSVQLTIDKNLTIDGSGLNPPVLLSGGNATRIMQLSFAANVAIHDLAFAHGASTSDGGAIYVIQSSQLTLQNSTLYQNQASGFGGAISATGNGAITIANSTLYENQAGGSGGALSATGNVIGTIVNSTFTNNSASGDGGAIYGPNVTLTETTLSSNVAGEDGGALYTTKLVMKNTTIDGNQANLDGGAMVIAGNGLGTIANSTVFQNQAGGHGGAVIVNGNAVLEIFNSTSASNSAANGKEVFLMGLTSLELHNTVFVCTTDSNTDHCYTEMFGSAILTDHSILGVGTLYDYGLAEPADNGGPTQTMALLPESSLIDVGDDSVCANPEVNNFDQRGVARPQGSHCDIGAYEDQSIIRYVKGDATGTGDGSSWTNAHTDLQSALAAASPDEELWVAAGTYKPAASTDPTVSFVLKNGVAIYGALPALNHCVPSAIRRRMSPFSVGISAFRVTTTIILITS